MSKSESTIEPMPEEFLACFSQPHFANQREKTRDLTKSQGLSRVGIQHVLVEPHSASWDPYAESEREEFVYVLSGEVDVWINGFLYSLQAGHFVGFPGGTGRAHSFINNSDTVCELIVGREGEKKESQMFFPLGEKNADLSSERLWENPPQHSLGPHLAKPGAPEEADYGSEFPSCIVFCPEVEEGKAYAYPGDNESFDVGWRISDRVGLKKFGVWFALLPGGRRSCFPHAHTHEEEFVFLLNGSLEAWVNGYRKKMTVGESVAFAANTGVSHTMINESSERTTYLCVGESDEFEGEKIFYPGYDLRNNECRRNGWLWEEPPVHSFGTSSSRPNAPFPGHMRLVELETNEWDADRPQGIGVSGKLRLDYCGDPVAELEFSINPAKETQVAISQLSDQKLPSAELESFLERYFKVAHSATSVRLNFVGET